MLYTNETWNKSVYKVTYTKEEPNGLSFWILHDMKHAIRKQGTV